MPLAWSYSVGFCDPLELNAIAMALVTLASQRLDLRRLLSCHPATLLPPPTNSLHLLPHDHLQKYGRGHYENID